MATSATSTGAGVSTPASSVGVGQSSIPGNSALGSASASPTPAGSITTVSIAIPTRTGAIPSGPPPNDSGGGNQFASSTASNLYLYTFLATLVLLLIVSGAVIIRSITIRLRARRAIEESIRNGTYVPPPPPLGGSNAATPALHDAHVKKMDSNVFVDEKNTRWESVVPIAASFIAPASSRALPPPAMSTSPRANTSVLSRIRSSNLNPFRTVQLQDILDELASRDVHARMALQQPPQPTQAELASAAFDTPGGGSVDQEGIGRPSAVRVAVLIAMPDPGHPTSVNVQNDGVSKSSASSSTSLVKGKTPAPVPGVAQTKTADEEAEMPYIEFGIADVPLSLAPPRGSSSPASSSPS